MRKAFNLRALPVLPVLLLIGAGCHNQDAAPVAPAPVLSPVPVSVVSPSAGPSVPVQVMPPAQPMQTPPPVAAPVADDSRAVAEYLAWMQQFDAAQNEQGEAQAKELIRRTQEYAQKGMTEENARPVREWQGIMRQTTARNMAALQSHPAPPACATFAQHYGAYIEKEAQLGQVDIDTPNQAPTDDGRQDRKAAGEELDKLLTAYPSVPRFALR